MTDNTLESLIDRYETFCLKHDLDLELAPEEQYDLSVGQQRWLDAHISRMTEARLAEAIGVQNVEGGTVLTICVESDTLDGDLDMIDTLDFYSHDDGRMDSAFS